MTKWIDFILIRKILTIFLRCVGICLIGTSFIALSYGVLYIYVICVTIGLGAIVSTLLIGKVGHV